MCGIVGTLAASPVNQLLYDALLLLQHRGQDAAGIVTMQGQKCFMHKARGMVRDVFRTRNMRALPGNIGLGQVRYPTAGNAYSEEEAQPFYVNAPYGIVLVHNGNLTNTRELTGEQARWFIDASRRRRLREPVAYITGTKGFRRIDLRVDRRVLIPRPETEHLVEAALTLPAGARVVDVGTGSGAIALMLGLVMLGARSRRARRPA